MAKITSVSPNHGTRGTEVRVEIHGTGFEPTKPAGTLASPVTTVTTAVPGTTVTTIPAGPPVPVPTPKGDLVLSGGDVVVSQYTYVSPILATAILALPPVPKLPLLRDVTFGGDTLEGGFIID